MVRLRRRRGVLAAAGGGAALVAVGVALLVVFTHRGASSPPPVLRAIAAPPLASATQTPSPLAVAPPADTPAPADLSDRQAPAYSAVFDLDIPAVGLHEPIASVALKNGSMDAPFGPLSSPVWHEAFWLNLSAEPGQPGTLTLAGHLDDTQGRPAAFWTVRQLTPGDVVSVTRRADGTVARYKITDVHAYSNAQADSAPVLARFYGTLGGGPADGVARISLITCTGRFVHGEYDHRFMAFGELLPAGSG